MNMTTKKDPLAAIRNHPVAVAVEPQRLHAMNKAHEFANTIIEKVKADLAAHGWELNAAAPYPKSTQESRESYRQKLAKHNLYYKLTQEDEARMQGIVRHPGHKAYRAASKAAEADFIAKTREDASAQYDAFIAKMVDKIGPCQSASIEGSHVWGYSFLTVAFADKNPELWKTQQIVNMSKYGMPFNQWPSRKVKTK